MLHSVCQEEFDEADDVLIKTRPVWHSEGKRKLTMVYNYVSKWPKKLSVECEMFCDTTILFECTILICKSYKSMK